MSAIASTFKYKICVRTYHIDRIRSLKNRRFRLALLCRLLTNKLLYYQILEAIKIRASASITTNTLALVGHDAIINHIAGILIIRSCVQQKMMKSVISKWLSVQKTGKLCPILVEVQWYGAHAKIIKRNDNA